MTPGHGGLRPRRNEAHPGDASVGCWLAAMPIMLMAVMTFDKCFLPIKGCPRGSGNEMCLVIPRSALRATNLVSASHPLDGNEFVRRKLWGFGDGCRQGKRRHSGFQRESGMPLFQTRTHFGRATSHSTTPPTVSPEASSLPSWLNAKEETAHQRGCRPFSRTRPRSSPVATSHNRPFSRTRPRSSPVATSHKTIGGGVRYQTAKFRAVGLGRREQTLDGPRYRKGYYHPADLDDSILSRHN
jgi:hypothetical protein